MTLNREESAGYMVNWAARLFARTIDRMLEGIGVSYGTLPVFFALSGGRSLSQRDLAVLAAVEQPTMAATLGRMERDGLIERRPDPADRRSQLIALAPGAEVKAEQIRAAADRVNAIAFQTLTPEEQAQFFDLIGRVARSLEAAQSGPPYDTP